MKRTNTDRDRGNGGSARGRCRKFCGEARKQLTAVKAAILAESSRALSAPDRLVRLALNEAEAAAWQTGYPHLLFPALATEKVQAVAAWNARQRALRPGDAGVAFAA